MRIVIVGPGALGSLLTARLFLLLENTDGSGNDFASLHLLDYKKERAESLQKNGLLYEEGSSKVLCRPTVIADPAVCAGSNILILCVKSNGVRAALEGIESYLTEKQLLLAMQNGIGHLQTISDAACPDAIGITSEGATLLHPGHVRHGGRGVTRLGLLSGSSAISENTLSKTASLFNTAGIKSVVTCNPIKYVWAKLFVNVGINALTALFGCKNGELLASSSALETMEKAVREAELIARAKGIPVEGDPVAATLDVCRTTAMNISSMLQDVQLHRRTEIDAINGAVVTEGERLGLAAPVNAELVRRVKELEASYV
jgi:2-dehydropantoate 2-reductase